MCCTPCVYGHIIPVIIVFIVQSSKSLFGGSATIDRLRALFSYEVVLKRIYVKYSL
jgi:hypothetical protein